MWWILSGLFILIAWALWYTLDLALAIPIVLSVLVVLGVIAVLIYRRFLMGRAASALERAIVNQGAQQAMNARPERRAEIQELQRQVQSGIAALKSSKLGKGKKSGTAALYSLPWYVIIGPPGAGKTTALKHSGMVFPYADPRSGGGVRGVGGTRNCDWWFTNEGILLDTAGRYTTEADDHDEWIAFLQMLKKFRSRRPLNGILVAVSITDVIDANEQQLESMAKKLRARVDEVMTQLQMVLPVYVLFTKCDLIAGFIEFFGDLRKSDRSQAWGTTVKMNADKTDPGRVFEAEFDVLTRHLHGRAVKRLVAERSRDAREKIFQFPLEFSGIRRNLAEMISTMFAVNAFQGTPVFRGFYFTSGTQEGRPLDRVLQRMGHAMGIRTQETAAQQIVESKSYFLHDMFMNVVFPDADIAARSASEMRRQKIVRFAVSGAAAALGIILAIPGITSFINNRRFLRETEERARAVAAIQWNEPRQLSEKLDTLKPMYERLGEIDTYRTEGSPVGMGWTMYEGETIYRPAVAVYVKSLQEGFVIPCKQLLEARLKLAKGDQYLRERTYLKTYLMLNDIENLDVEYATGKYTSLWAEVLRPISNLPEADLRKQLTGHVNYYLTLLKGKKVTPIPTDTALAEKVRGVLQAVPVRKRYYDLFVNSLIDEKYDETGDNSRSNRRFPPQTLADIFSDRPDVLKYVTSKLFQKEKRFKEVDGPYTEVGHFEVLANIAEGAGLLEREQWVVPLGRDEQADSIAKHLDTLANDYDQLYIQQWTEWMADLQVQTPANLKEAKALYIELAKPDYPFLRILRRLEDHTQWKRDQGALGNKAVTDRINQAINTKLASQTRGLRFNVDVKKIRGRLSAVPNEFKRTVEFGVPGSQAGSTPITDTSLAKYVRILEGVRDEVQKLEDQNPNVDARLVSDKLVDAIRQTEALLQQLDDKGKTLLRPMLLNPLLIAAARLPPLNTITRVPAQQAPR
ncbi:type VI secretion system membrane subunit TssM [Chondromyces apiculatus]|uniref:IcmF-related protein n=1 Tax=Chondromyces apiculatus DSM 436 TaxID=1192034 RepID=A0A017SY79_9BACT|nr:type VI secretion system membrane subunit TssM [Chondromyces apiculatus]EYF01261.1 IcmF-related protein [Chondromyces apiculatus DSM 436]